MFSNKKCNPVVTEFFIRGEKLNISLAFITQSSFAVPKNIRLNSTHQFIVELSNKLELQQSFKLRRNLIIPQILTSKDINLYKKYTAKPYSFLVIDTTLASDNPFRFRQNLLERI